MSWYEIHVGKHTSIKTIMSWCVRPLVAQQPAARYARVILYTAGHLHTTVPHCLHNRAPIVHTAVSRENNEHGCVYLRCRAVCKLPGCVEGHPCYSWLADTTQKRHKDVIKWKHFPRYWPFVRGIHRWPVDSPHKGQRRGALIFFWCAPEQTVEQTLETPVIWDAIALVMTSL